MCCNVLQCVAVEYCRVNCSVKWGTFAQMCVGQETLVCCRDIDSVCCVLLQRVAVCCSMLQRVAILFQ